MSKNILNILDETRAISIEGLTYAKDKYDVDRYKRLMEITAVEYSKILDLPKGSVLSELRKEIGCITPKLGVDVAIINTDGELLILKRTDDNKWSLPCGWVDVGESPFDTALRESKEETGIDIKPLGYIAITEKGPHLYPKLTHQVNILVATKLVEKKTSVNISHEHSKFRWINKKEAKKINWHPGHERLIRPIFNFVEDGKYIPHFE
jgi:8-oxo-dGTP pyrophosphatase MutT (NUDIX family)